ncbi:hypothetical protein OG320_17615 [Microbispora sp. NBC_01189]|uniref:hypothetical protein n=1 Tax=Microbispora sp. NBC_01189 TaxID=2903583 RepID=UPI002E0F4A71|nr:hypothetical protein OG320_17615 [Microbispora sp. NBC_01189]
MTLNRAQSSVRRVGIHPALFVVLLVIAAAVGAFITHNLPYGSKTLTYSYGTATVTGEEGSGVVTIDKEGNIPLPSDIPWVDRGGRAISGGRPECLKGNGDEQVSDVRVEVGYLWVRLPDGKGSYPMVGWLRCL